MELKEEDLLHYGVLRRSGRYPWGSGGENGYSEDRRNPSFLDLVAGLRAKGLSESEVATGMGMTISQLRAKKSIAKNEQRAADIALAQRLHDKGMSNIAIGARMGKPESTIRSLLAPGAADRADILKSTADMLKREVDSKGFIDISSGTEGHIELSLAPNKGISATRLETAAALLQEQGYVQVKVKVPQVGTGEMTTIKVLAPPGTTQREVFLNQDKIRFIGSFSDDGGRSFTTPMDPLSVNPRRIQVKYKEDGGDQADGVVFVRPGVKDVSLGGAKYAQVRVKVGETHYIKGMAIYKDDLPPGVDLVVNTNKRAGTPLMGDKDNSVLKPLKDDPDLPFGTIVNQIGENLGTPKAKVTSAMNTVYEAGDWSKWSRTLSSQMLSKQSPRLVKSQLDMTFEQRKATFDEINALTNPVVRKRLLEDFASGTDAAAVHLKAAALPRQGTHVILPLSNIKPTEVFAPNYQNGQRVVLIRHPHGGPFEIPELIVNNRNAEGRNLLGPNSRDAIGIHHTVASWLSGADFDGDTVLVIPNDRQQVKTKRPLKDLEGFDPQSAYPGYSGMKRMKNTQTEMGKISNLITDMSIRGASDAELARAVKHSMVVIDAEKHNLNYKQSYSDNGIKLLKEKYQQGGASTIISRAKSRLDVPERKPRTRAKGGPVDKATGELRFEPTNRLLRGGKPALTRTTKLAEARDAHRLSSGTAVERIYADHSNRLKGLANQARLAAINTPTPKQSPSARKTYEAQVNSLNSKLAIAIRNRPLERQAQLIANASIKAKRDANPDMDKDTLKKIKAQALNTARLRTGAGKQRIRITPEEWTAIQAGAISASKLSDILNNSDMDVVRELATPKSAKLMTPTKTGRAKQMLDQGYTRAEVAQALGVSLSTLDEATGA